MPPQPPDPAQPEHKDPTPKPNQPKRHWQAPTRRRRQQEKPHGGQYRFDFDTPATINYKDGS